MKVRKNVVGGMLLAIGIVLPLALHATGVPQIGQIFLPMHIPVLIAGFILGPFYGSVIGILCPILGTITMGMPAIDRMPFMVIELFVYGLVSGLLTRKFNPASKKWGFLVCLIITQVCGRLAYAVSLVFALGVLNIPWASPALAWAAVVKGIPGIIIQIVIIPIILAVLIKTGELQKLEKNPERKQKPDK